MSTYNNGAIDNNFASDAEWQAWCQAYDAAIRASGFLVPASDTGQINLTTAVRPAAGAYAGFKMYKGGDALQATKPIFLKVEYGVASGTNRPKLQIGVGTNTDGVGGLTGQTNASNALLNPTVDGTGGARIFGGGGEFDAWVMVYDGATAAQGCHLHVGRLMDRDDGSEVGPLSWFTYASSANSTPFGNTYYCDGAAAWNSLSNAMTLLAPDLSIGIHTGGDINKTLLFEWLVYRAAKALVLPALSGKSAELPFTDPDASAFSLSVWGGNHTFVPLPMPQSSAVRACVLWE